MNAEKGVSSVANRPESGTRVTVVGGGGEMRKLLAWHTFSVVARFYRKAEHTYRAQNELARLTLAQCITTVP